MKEEMKKLNNLPRITDRISFLYVEYARIETEEYSIVILQGSNKIVIPIATVLCLILGTGISITHNVIKILCENQCNCMFVGSECNYFYASGNSSDRNAQNIIQQAECYYDKDKHLQIVKQMYKKRYPNINITTTNLATLRGIEGKQMKELYTSLATKYNIDWNGRISQNWENADTINKNLTSINQLLYCICHAVINNLGYSTVFGFIHTGKYNSFVYDIADLYKEEFVLPLVFEKTSLNCSITEIRTAFRTLVVEKQLLKRMVNDLKTIFGDTSNYDGSGYLWDTTENVKAGYNFFNESI